MRTKLSPLVTLAIAALLSTPAWAARDCPKGSVIKTITLPTGATHSICVPLAAADGIGHAPPNSPLGASCPCFTDDRVEAAILADKGYRYEERSFGDASGNKCVYRGVETPNAIYAAMAKVEAPKESCVTARMLPYDLVNPNGCFAKDPLGSIIANPITPEEAGACLATLGEFAP